MIVLLLFKDSNINIQKNIINLLKKKKFNWNWKENFNLWEVENKLQIQGEVSSVGHPLPVWLFKQRESFFGFYSQVLIHAKKKKNMPIVWKIVKGTSTEQESAQ